MMVGTWWKAGLVLAMLVMAGCASVSPIPAGSGGHRVGAAAPPISNEPGTQFLADVNSRFTGATPISPALATQTFTTASTNVTPATSVYNCNAASNSEQFLVPAGKGGGKFYTFKKTDSSSNTCLVRNGASLAVCGSQTLDAGGLSYSLTTQGQSVTIYDSGACQWNIWSRSSSPLMQTLLTGGNAIQGSASNGSDQINGISVNGVFNVMAYGAKCDGATDDAAAIQSALTACNNARTASGSPTVFVPATASSCKISRPLVNASTSNQTTCAIGGAGATASTIAPTFTGDALVLVGQGPASQIKTSVTANIIPGGAGPSMTWAAGSLDFFDLSEVLPQNISVQPYVGVFNGNTQWDIRLFFMPTDLSATHCMWASTGAYNSVLYTGGDLGIGGMGYLCTESDAKLHGALRVNGTLIQVVSGVLTVNTVYEGELNLDSSHNVNLLVGTGGTVTRVAQVASGGTAITQRADENNLLGAAAQWPLAVSSVTWQGALQSVQISNLARHTATYTEDAAAFAQDGNTLFLDNFDLNQFVGGAAVNPTAQVDYPASSWIALHIGELGCCGGTYNVTGLNFGISTVGIFADAAAVDISHVVTNATYAGIEISRTSGFNSFIHDITEYQGVDNSAGGVFGILSMGGITFIRDVILNQANAFPIYTTGSSVVNAYIATNTRNQCGVVAETGGQGVNVLPVHLEHIVQDTENGGTFPSVCITGNGPISVTGSVLTPSGVASAIQLIGVPGTVTLQGNNFIQSAQPIVDTTYSPLAQNTNTAGASIVFDNNTYAGSYTPFGTSSYVNFNFPYSLIGHTPSFHHLQIPVAPTPELGAANAAPLCPSATTCPYSVPKDAHVGDVEIAAIALQGGAPGTVTAPAGWTLAPSCTADNSANNDWVAIYWHVVTAADTSTYAWTSVNSINYRGGVVAFSGINQLAPIDQCVTSTATGATSITLTGMTSSDQNDLDLLVADNVGFTGAQMTLPSPPAGVVFDFFGQQNTLSIWSYLPASTTIPNVTVNNGSTSTNYAGVQIALRPAIAQSSLLTAGQGSPPLYSGQPGAMVSSLVLKSAPLAAFGSCNSGTTAGAFARESNSTAACSPGATATSGGSTPCFIVCNQTNWLQLGY